MKFNNCRFVFNYPEKTHKPQINEDGSILMVKNTKNRPYNGTVHPMIPKMIVNNWGRTVKCQIIDADGALIAEGTSKAFNGSIDIKSNTFILPDNFCKETGRRTALHRALLLSGWGKEDRTTVMEMYRTQPSTPRWKTKVVKKSEIEEVAVEVVTEQAAA